MATEPPEKKQKTEDVVDVEGESNTVVDVEMGENAAPDATEEAAKEEESTPEPVQELETDAAEDKAARIKETVAILTPDTTLNLLPSTVGNVLMSLSEGGFQYFLAGARANVGVKSGRYMFEVKILQYVDPAEDTRMAHGRRPSPKQLMKVGFSVPGSSLLLGDGDDNVSFDSEGSFVKNKQVTKVCSRFGRDTVVGVLLNLDESSPNANTVSLFLDGIRVCPPQALPDTLKGKVLYPTVSFRNVTVHMNFGPEPMAPLPFKCRMIQDANSKDASVTKYEVPKDGKFEVLFPVCLPDEGSFDWLDSFLEKNPHYCELSDRAILKMAERSGIWRPKGYNFTSMDKPGWEFGIPLLDDFSVRTILKQVAPIQPRNFIVMEVKGNLVKEDRTALLPLWSSPAFKPIAQIVVGEPTSAFKKLSQEKLLKDKQVASDNAWRAQKLEEQRKKAIEKQQRDAERAKRKAEKEERKKQRELKKQAILERKAAKEAEAKRKAEEAAARKAAEEKAKAEAAAAKEAEEKAKAEAEAKAKAEAEEKAKAEGKDAAGEQDGKEAGEKPADVEMKPSEEAKTEEKTDEKMPEKAPEEAKASEDTNMEGQDEKKEEEKEEEEEEEEMPPESEDEPEEEEKVEAEEEEDPPKVELDDDEKKAWFYKGIPDLTPYMLNTTFAKFTLPEKEEGFHDIRYSWSAAEKAAEYLKAYKLEKKITMRMEDLTPSDWFYERSRAFQRATQAWHAKHNEWKAAVAKKVADRQAKARKKVEAERAKADAEAKAKEPQEAQEPAEEKKPEDAEMKAEEETKKTEEETKAMDVDEKKEEEKDAEKKDEDKMEEDKEEEEEEEKENDVEFDGLDIFDVDDICDVGGGMPLFKEFGFEDWAMTTLRFELYLLVQAFRKDCGDPERAGIHLDHLSFYYNKYYKKTLGAKYYGVEDFKALVGLIKDSVYITKQKVLDTQLPEQLETFSVFIKLAEEARRYRNLRLDLGEEDARLKVTQVPYDSQKGGYHHYDRKGQKRDYKGDGKKGYDRGYDKGYHKGKHSEHVVPYSTPPPPHAGSYKGSEKGHHKSYDKGLPPPPPQYVPAYTPPPPPVAGKDGKGKDGKNKDGKSKQSYDTRNLPPPPPTFDSKGGAPKGGHYEDRGASKGHYEDRGAPKGGYQAPPPPPHKGSYDQKGGYGKEQPKGAHHSKDVKGGKDVHKGSSYDKGAPAKGSYGKGGFEKGSYGKGGFDKGKSYGK